MDVLLTTSCLPFSVEEIRKLGRAGHRVIATDTFRTSAGIHSRYVSERFVTASPRHATRQFIDDIASIVTRHHVDRIIPTFEEAFYLSKHRARLPPGPELWTPPFETLAQLHDKLAFLELCGDLDIETPPTIVARSRDELEEAGREFQRFFARPAYSRGGVTLYTNTGPLAGAVKLEDCNPTVRNPFLVQPFVEGLDVCCFNMVHHGRVAAHAAYVHPKTLEHAGGIVFESIEGSDTLAISRKLAEATNYHGQMSLDFLRVDSRLLAVECNPRPTAGVVVLPDEMFDTALMDRKPDETQLAPPGLRRQIMVAVARDMLRDFKSIPSDLAELLSGDPDVYAAPHDLLPALYSLLSYSHVLSYRIKHRHIRSSDLMAAYFEDVLWDGDELEDFST